MRILLIYAHPNPDSFNAAVRDAAVETLAANGHEVRLRDLYATGFNPVMNRKERGDYHTPEQNEQPVSEHVADVRWCEGMVFVYPTWWFGLPAMLKGWLDRVFLPYVAFTMPNEQHGVQPLLRHVRVVAAVTTCGSSFLVSKFVGEPGRRTLLRGLKLSIGRQCRTRYVPLYKIDTSSPAQRQAFLDRVRVAMMSL